uniref:Coatomer subunit zeta n=1 Tax=Eptatretus burgeri TaxID=7764 RepID=A0A8C4QKZ1_EPTBU
MANRCGASWITNQNCSSLLHQPIRALHVTRWTCRSFQSCGEGGMEPSLYTVKAIIILDNDGERIYAKYYDSLHPTVKEQKTFEKNIFGKTHRSDSEIALLEGLTVVYKSSVDLYFYVVGSSQENELMLMAVLNCLVDVLNQMFRKSFQKRVLLENMDGVLLAVDEIVDGGVILESDPNQVVQRVALRPEPGDAAYGFVLFDILSNKVPGQ